MGYQALLFCSDEKTAGLVTQVLQELEFSVEPANEAFAAVKRLTTQHFDAVVVDCENEQNAALLFKSARNSGPNRTSLAVAVVEGQPGIAKAFRIGANLVLTKPINVEQSKGTLRVARGLLKKGEAAKAAAASPAAIAPQAPATPARPAANPSVARTLTPAAQTLKPVPPKFVTTPPAPVVRAEAPSTLELDAEPGPPTEAVDAALLEAMPDPLAPSSAIGGKHAPWPPTPGANPFLTNSPTAHGAAVAPAREMARPADQLESKPYTARPMQSSVSALAVETPAPASSLAQHQKAPSGGGQKWIFIAAVLLLLAAGGYFGWSKFLKHPTVAVSSTPVQSAPLQTVQATPSAATQSPAPSSLAPATAAAPPHPTAPAAQETASSEDESATETAKRSAAPAKAAAAPAHEALVVKSAPKSTVADLTAQAIPAIGMAPVANDKAIAGIIEAAPSGRAPVLHAVKVSQGVSQGLVTKRVAPDYPSQARQMRIEGAVQLETTIAKDGSVTNVKVVGGHPMLARAAVDAVKQWKYRPYLLNGQPVQIETQITVVFKLP